MKKKVVIGLLGPNLDSGVKASRWERWRPSVSICQHEDFLIDRLELIYQEKFNILKDILVDDIQSISPETEVNALQLEMADPWDFEEVYGTLYDFARNYKFKEDEDYYIHITTGTHVAQICLFLLTESRHFPARLLQSSPPAGRSKGSAGLYTTIDLDLSRYDKLANRFLDEKNESYEILKSGISTKNKQFNKLIEQIEKVSIRSTAPILLMGPTGAGKSQLARKVFDLKKQRHQLSGSFVEVNCATLRGDTAMSTLFGHKKGAFTGAQTDRAGLLAEANNGILFLDEIGELGLDEQTMLLRALEDKTFLPVGSDKEASSKFQFICGTNRDLRKLSAEGKFRDDLLARINIWSFELPGLKDRKDDLLPNIEYELAKITADTGSAARFTTEAKKIYTQFSKSSEALWKGNFRDLNASILRMATLSDTGRIGPDIVEEEINRLKKDWQFSEKTDQDFILEDVLSDTQIEEIDPFDRPQLSYVIEVCQKSKSLSEAGRFLFSKSRVNKKAVNDSDRLRKYLAKFNLNWNDIQK